MRSIFYSRWRQSLSALFPLGAAGLLVAGLGQVGLLLPLVQAEYGLRFRLRGQRAWAEQVVLIAIDDPSLATLGAFPWRRQYYADLLERLQGYPSVVVFDLLFSDPSPDDGEFAAAIAAHPAVILATAWDRQGRSLRPTPPLIEAALATGHIVQQHQGGYIHSVTPLVGNQPALAIVTAEALGLTRQALPLPPLDRPLWVNWPGSAQQLETYSFVDVLEGRVAPQDFADKVVVIGATALGLDDWVTPFDASPSASGVYLHSALVDNLIAQRWLRPVPGAWPSALMLALGLSLSLQRIGLGAVPWRHGALTAGLVLGWWSVALGLLGFNVWLPVVGPGLLLSTVGGLATGRAMARQNRWLQNIATGLRSRHWPELVLPRASSTTRSGAMPTPDRASSLTQLIELTEQLGRSQAIQAAIARSLPQGLVAAGGDGIVWFANPLATEWLGISAGDNLATALVPTWFERGAWQQIWATVVAGQPLPPQIKAHPSVQSSPAGAAALTRWYELRLEPLGADQGSPAPWPQGAILLIDDVTYRQRMEADLRRLNSSLEAQVRVRTRQLEQLNQSLQEQIVERQQAQHQLAYEALHDQLTGLPNRRQFLTHLNTQLGQAATDLYAVLFLDCDRFKLINDSFGHTVGDELLKAVGNIVQDCVRPADVVARFGGDEFVVLLVQINQVEDAIAVAQRIRQRFTDSLDIQGHQLFTNTSIGIVIGGPQYQDSADLLRDADTAMYQAKANDLGYALFEPGMHLSVRRSLQIQTALRLALDRREFQLHYQPILTLDSGQLMGCEALIRWLHPDRGLLLPADFLATAEDTGLMGAIGTWVLQEACGQMQRWRHRGLMPTEAVVSVNLSASQFAQAGLVTQIDAVLTSSGLPAANLKLEITETVVIQNADQVIPMLVALRDRGICLSIDDFGTGYSSLGYLQELPVDMLKIDRSFISDIHSNPRQHGIVETIIRLATHLDIQVIAEGIEQFSQLQSLSQLGCEFGQGFLFARPLSVSQFSQYLRRHH